MNETECIASNSTESGNKVNKLINSQGPQLSPALNPEHYSHVKVTFGRLEHKQ